jgi:hypothetical protein
VGSKKTMSIIDYAIINDLLKNNFEDRRVFIGCEIDSDHRLLERKFKYRPTISSKHSHI